MLITKEIADVIDDIKRTREFISQCKKQEASLLQKLYNLVGEEDVFVDGETGQEIATWEYSKPVERFDAKLFKDSHPALYKDYVIKGEPTRTLRIAKD